MAQPLVAPVVVCPVDQVFPVDRGSGGGSIGGSVVPPVVVWWFH